MSFDSISFQKKKFEEELKNQKRNNLSYKTAFNNAIAILGFEKISVKEKILHEKDSTWACFLFFDFLSYPSKNIKAISNQKKTAVDDAYKTLYNFITQNDKSICRGISKQENHQPFTNEFISLDKFSINPGLYLYLGIDDKMMEKRVQNFNLKIFRIDLNDLSLDNNYMATVIVLVNNKNNARAVVDDKKYENISRLILNNAVFFRCTGGECGSLPKIAKEINECPQFDKLFSNKN